MSLQGSEEKTGNGKLIGVIGVYYIRGSKSGEGRGGLHWPWADIPTTTKKDAGAGAGPFARERS